MKKRLAKMEVRVRWPMGSPQYWWRMVGANGQIIVHSEMFTRRADAKRAMLRAIAIIRGAEFKVEE